MSTADDIATVTQLVLHERQARDRRWWERMREQYWPDATVHLSWFDGGAYENVDASAQMNAERSVSLHRLSPPAIHVDGDRALVELPTEIETATVIDGIPAMLHTFLRIVYRAQRRNGQWRIFRLDTIYERDALVSAAPDELPRIDPDELASYRSPFRLLAWFLARRGYAVLDDLLGDDRPDDVAAFYDREFDWLRAG